MGDWATVYTGGCSEAAFEFAANGDLWAVMRNEDGDDTGFGSLLCWAPADALGEWSCPSDADPWRYDSPKMFRHGEEIYLVARRDVGGPYDEGLDELTVPEQRAEYLVNDSSRPKRTSLYWIDQTATEVVWLLDLPSAGDTCFPSVRRTGVHTFRVANFTSPLEHEDWSWLEGQTSREGTQIYLIDIEMVPVD